MVDELERVDALQERARALDLAQNIAFAVNDPAQLARIEVDLKRAMRNEPLDESRVQTTVQSIEDAVSLMERIERRKRRSGISGA